jgi:hypothetical protein
VTVGHPIQPVRSIHTDCDANDAIPVA